MLSSRILFLTAGLGMFFTSLGNLQAADQSTPWQLQLRSRTASRENSSRFHLLTRAESWNPSETAFIVCDVWDYHHCLNAVRRMGEFLPRMNEVLNQARASGAVIIHSPSDCMETYANHPARARAQQAPAAGNLPSEIQAWCHRIPAEERAVYPIDQSDGGEDDDQAEHNWWAAKLASLGRNPKMPWKAQHSAIEINSARDYISDKGDEVWNILESRGIKNVVLLGVHTNMCVLGRPFGLRNLARAGKNVVLMRDMTDTMYNPQRPPYVSHFAGTDLIIEHIEKYVAPTITSDQILGGQPFRFAGDKRPHLVMLIGEDEYDTAATLPNYVSKSRLLSDFRVTSVFSSDADPNDFPGIGELKQADILLVSVRRRTLKTEQLGLIREFARSGKPVVGIRTASHAFLLRDNAPPPPGHASWPEFDQQVFGGNYQNHFGNKADSDPKTVITSTPNLPAAWKHFFAEKGNFVPRSWLYKTAPVNDRAVVMMLGQVGDSALHPVTWTFVREDGGRSFYTSLGHPDDFSSGIMPEVLDWGLRWAAGLPTPSSSTDRPKTDNQLGWQKIEIPRRNSTSAMTASPVRTESPTFFRCFVRIPEDFRGQSARLLIPATSIDGVFVNGQPVNAQTSASAASVTIDIDSSLLQLGELNLLALRQDRTVDFHSRTDAPKFKLGNSVIDLAGTWEFHSAARGQNLESIPLPPKFGAPTHAMFELRPPQVVSRR